MAVTVEPSLFSRYGRCQSGLTLIEILVASAVLAVAMAAILGAHLGQQVLNEHARNLSLAAQDAERAIEGIRYQNRQCNATPTANPPGGFANWHAWLSTPPPLGFESGGGPLSLADSPEANEQVVVTCQGQDAGGNLQYCPDPQMGAEWHAPGPAGVVNPLEVTVAVCWRHRQRTIGECAWNGAVLTANEGILMPQDTAGVIDSPVMMTTLVTCRG